MKQITAEIYKAESVIRTEHLITKADRREKKSLTVARRRLNGEHVFEKEFHNFQKCRQHFLSNCNCGRRRRAPSDADHNIHVRWAFQQRLDQWRPSSRRHRSHFKRRFGFELRRRGFVEEKDCRSLHDLRRRPDDGSWDFEASRQHTEQEMGRVPSIVRQTRPER